MISIYCLVDPRTNKPFYVGATIDKLKNRLSGHKNETKSTYLSQKNPKINLIKEILNAGMKPEISLLYIADVYNVDYYEYFFYNLLKSYGFNLLQLSSAFGYSKKFMSEKNKWTKREYRRFFEIKQYHKIYFKNILIIIW